MLLAQGQDTCRARIDRFVLGLLLPLGLRPEEGLCGVFAKGMAEVLEGAVGVPEADCGFPGGEALHVEGPEGLIAFLFGMDRLTEEVGLEGHNNTAIYEYNHNVLHTDSLMQQPGKLRPVQGCIQLKPVSHRPR